MKKNVMIWLFALVAGSVSAQMDDGGDVIDYDGGNGVTVETKTFDAVAVVGEGRVMAYIAEIRTVVELRNEQGLMASGIESGARMRSTCVKKYFANGTLMSESYTGRAARRAARE